MINKWPPIAVKICKETDVDLKFSSYKECHQCKSKLTAVVTWNTGEITKEPVLVNSKFCDECKNEKKTQLSKKYYKLYKKPNPQRYCKSCGIEVDKGKQCCSKCRAQTRITYKQNKKKLYNGLTKPEEIQYYINLASKVSSYKELHNLDTMPNKRSYSWLVKYCKPNWMVSVSEHNNRIQLEKVERDTKRVAEIRDLSYVKRIISSEHKFLHPLIVEFECTNGHTIKRPYKYIIKETKCSICSNQAKSIYKKEVKLLDIESNRNQKQNDKLNEALGRVKIVSDFIDSGEYKNYKNWTNAPIIFEYVWLRNGCGKKYLTNELKYRLDTISYFEYMYSNKCPYPTKKNHKWCKKCRKEQHIDEFRSVYICKDCSLQYRRDEYYETDKIKGREAYKNDPLVRLDSCVRTYIHSALKGKPKSRKTVDILGMSIEEFRNYVESNFENWMHWDNHGNKKGQWALQHIVPRNFATNEDEIYLINYHKNLIPMCSTENNKLQNRILNKQLNEWHVSNKPIQTIIQRNKDRIVL
jgi:hypothetical protein